MADLSGLFRQAMRRFPAAVSIITTHAKGHDLGMTATAVTSLSLEPPSLLVCINRNNGFFASLDDTPHFCVNVLRHGQQDLSANFGGAKPPSERFEPSLWQHVEGIPFLPDAQSVILCRKTATFQHTTHAIVIGEAIRIIVRDEITPLIYLDGGYGLGCKT